MFTSSRLLTSALLLGCMASPTLTQAASAPAPAQASSPLGTPLTAAELTSLIPATVFFRGQTAPVQIRNAGAVRFSKDAVLFAVLVDNSGYSSGIRESYQFYLVTESPITFGGQQLAPGAYGGGFLNDNTFTIMDIGGHPVIKGAVETDAKLQRPRPLQMLPGTSGSVRLFLGRNFVTISSR